MLVTLINVDLETNEGIRILEYDMCIWVRYKWVNKEKVKVKNEGTQAFWMRSDT